MILSPYRNPAYRSPTPRDRVSPQTPKRKREEVSERLETQFHAEDISDPGANSPRTKVADRLKDLNIQQLQPTPFQTNDIDVQRKRIKRRSRGCDSPLQTSSPASELQLSESSETAPCEGTGSATAAVEETPDCRTKRAWPPSPSPQTSPTRPIAYVEITPPKHETNIQRPVEAELSSSPEHLLAVPAQGQDTIDRSASPLPSKGDLTPDQPALTWQDHEITGHEIDPSGDDDGEGINGIGFRPTAAMAAARQQRRKQQVTEWKAREAREARQRRVERRRGANGTRGVRGHDDGIGDAVQRVLSSPTAARMVRFVRAGE